MEDRSQGFGNQHRRAVLLGGGGLALAAAVPFLGAGPWMAGLLPRALTRGFWRGTNGPLVAGEVCVWVADRDGGVLYGLDGDLLVHRVVPLTRPVRVFARRGGRAFVLEAPEGPGGAHLWSEVDRRGAVQGLAHLRPVRAAARLWAPERALQGERVALIEGAHGPLATTRLALFGAGFPPGGLALAGPSQAMAVASGPGGLLTIGAGGLWELRSPAEPEQVLSEGRLTGAEPEDLAPRGGAQPGWWLLDARPPMALVLLDSAVRELHRISLAGFAAAHLAARGHGDRVWLADADQGAVRCYDSTGLLVAEFPPVPGAAPQRGAALPDGGWLVAAGGAVLVLGPTGRVVKSQGGFVFSVDADACG